MTGCETAAALPQAAIQRDALSTDEVQHALSMRIATPVVPASPVAASADVPADVPAAVPVAVPVAVPAVEEEKVEEKEEKKEEEVKETVKEEEKVQTAPKESAEQIQEETPAKAHKEEENATELSVKSPSGDCCIVMWCPCSTNNGDAATLC